MSIRYPIISFLFLACAIFCTTTIIHAQNTCTISDLTVDKSECTSSGTFSVTLAFKHEGTVSDQGFSILGNGKNYGTYSYDSLPITLSGLVADCETAYEFVVRDNIYGSTCNDFLDLGTVCCENRCAFRIKSIATSACRENRYDITFFITDYGHPQEFVDVYRNGNRIGYYRSNEDSITINNNLLDVFNTLDTWVICVNDQQNCCDTITIPHPCICNIYNLQYQIIHCDETDSTFSLLLDFDYSLTSDSFTVGGSGINYGVFPFDQIPIQIDSISLDRPYFEFIVADNNQLLCFNSIELEAPIECNKSCILENLSLSPYPCEDDSVYIKISFDATAPSIQGFSIRGNGRLYGQYTYGQPFYVIGPIAPDCETIYEFVIIDNGQEGCTLSGHIRHPLCCASLCSITDISITEECEENELIAINIDFEYINANDSFDLTLNGVFIDRYAYSEIPIKLIGRQWADPVIEGIIENVGLSQCSSSFRYELECTNQQECTFTNIDIKANDCRDDNSFTAILRFDIHNAHSDRFIIYGTNNFKDTIRYNSEGVYEIGPLIGDCATNYVFEFVDFERRDCQGRIVLGTVCCEHPCDISQPQIVYFPCVAGQYEVSLDFQYTNTPSDKFIIIRDGAYLGEYLYTSLPVYISEIDELTTLNMTIQDKEQPICNLGFLIPGIQCLSSIDGHNHNNVPTLQNNGHTLTLNYPYNGEISVYNIFGQFITWQGHIAPSTEIDTAHIPTGIYIVQFKNKEYQWQAKVFIDHR